MNAIIIHKRIESVTIHLPELTPLIGKTVEIVVREDTSAVAAGTVGWDAAMQAARELENYDLDAVRQQRDYDQKHAQDHLP